MGHVSLRGILRDAEGCSKGAVLKLHSRRYQKEEKELCACPIHCGEPSAVAMIQRLEPCWQCAPEGARRIWGIFLGDTSNGGTLFLEHSQGQHDEMMQRFGIGRPRKQKTQTWTVGKGG